MLVYNLKRGELVKIGVGIVTFERFDRFKRCFESVIKHSQKVNEIVVIDDCSKKDRKLYDAYFKELALLNKVKILIQETNGGVGKAKNKVLRYFTERDYDYIFTIEDDMLIISDDTFEKYIWVSQKTGINYLNFALHGPANIGNKIRDIDEISVYVHCVGSFSLHTKKLIEQIGYYDEKFKNAWEHVDYCYQASLKELTTPFGYFADVKDSINYVNEQEGSIEDGRIRNSPDWMYNVDSGQRYFKEKNGVDVIELIRSKGFA